MKHLFRAVLFVFLIGTGFPPVEIWADQSPADRGVKTRGLHFDVAEDRQIENYGGVFQPETLDKYMKRKFDSISSDIRSLDQKVDKIATQLNEIQSRLKK